MYGEDGACIAYLAHLQSRLHKGSQQSPGTVILSVYSLYAEFIQNLSSRHVRKHAFVLLSISIHHQRCLIN